MFRKLLSAKAAIAAGAVVLGVAGAAAATGTLPRPAQQAADRMLSAVGASAQAVDHGTSVPHAAGSAKAGLCRAWAAGQGREHGAKADAAALTALATAAGGAGNIAAYCADSTTRGPTTPPTPTTASQAGSGAPDDPGRGRGAPPSTIRGHR